MLHLDHCKRLRYLAVILAWVGYASGLSAAPLQLESTPLFLNVKAEPNVILWSMIPGHGLGGHYRRLE